MERVRKFSSAPVGHNATVDEPLFADRPPEGSTPANIKRIGQYRLIKVLGKGGMGIVYKAEHSRLEMIVAVKVLSDHLTNNAEAVARFDREMKAVGKINHLNIVRATDAGIEDGYHYLAMEFVEGADLGQLLKSTGRFQVNDACEAIRQASIGIYDAHQNGLIHRDLKPSNIMATADGQIKVLDLGLALLHRAATGQALTNDFQVMGTADYMAPEQALQAASVDEMADLYSLGCTLYSLLCGTPPFAEPQHNSPLRKLMAHEQEAPVAAVKREPSVPIELSNIIDRALAKLPEERFASAKDFADSLLPFCTGANLAAIVARSRTTTHAETGTADLNGREITTSRMPVVSPVGRMPAGGNRRGRWALWITLVALTGSLLLAVVLKLTTANGTIVLQVDGDGIGARIEGETLIIEDRNSDNVYHLSIANRSAQRDLNAGSYSIRVANEDSGLRLTTRDFEITRGDTVVVSVFVERPAAGVVPHDRSVSEWVLANGGDVEVISHNQFRVVTTVADLPDDGFLLHRIRFWKRVDISDEDFAKLSTLPRLADINLRGVDLTDAFVSRLARLPQLNIIQLECTSVSAATLKPLRHLTGLLHVSLEGPAIDDRAATMVSELGHVRELIFRRATLSNDCLIHLQDMAQLEWLQLLNCATSDIRLQSLRQLPNLKRLNLSGTDVTNDCLREIRELDSVRELLLKETSISDDALPQIAMMPSLQTLSLAGTTITNTGIAALAPTRELRSLDLSGTKTNDGAVPYLAALSQLTDLELADRLSADAVQDLKTLLPNCTIGSTVFVAAHESRSDPDTEHQINQWALEKGAILTVTDHGQYILVDTVDGLPGDEYQTTTVNFLRRCDFTDEDFARLRKLKHLNHLEFQDLPLSETVVRHLQRFAKLQILELRYDQIEPQGIAQLHGLAYLQDLTVGGALVGNDEVRAVSQLHGITALTMSGRQITNDGLPYLAKMRRLGFLSLIFTQVDGNGLAPLHRLTKLDSLHLPYTQMTDDGARNLTGFTNLEWLVLGGTKITDDTLKHVAALSQLKTLSLHETQVTTTGLRYLQSLSRLRELELTETAVTDQAVENLGELKGLKRLEVGDRLSADAVNELQKLLPVCRIESSH